MTSTVSNDMVSGQVGFLGPKGSFTHQAAMAHFGSSFDYVPMAGHVIARWVADGRQTDPPRFGVMAMENIVHGFIEVTFNYIHQVAGVHIVGEVLLPVQFELLSHAKTIDEIETVMSHEAALSQCRQHLDRMESDRGRPLPRSTALSTSTAVQLAASNPTIAALGSADAGQRYGVPILRAAQQDHRHNATRFWVLGQRPNRIVERKAKTVFMVELADTHSSICQLSRVIADAGARVNWLKPHVIPHMSSGAKWKYGYFIECEGDMAHPSVHLLERALRRPGWSALRGRSGRLLGSFQAATNADMPPTTP